MAVYRGPKCRLCRREGEKLYLKGERCFTEKCAFERRKYPPGQHGPITRYKKLSVYGLQLREKQKVKRIYGIKERSFRRYFELARKLPGNTGENLLSILERRLDNVVYQMGFALSRSHARQLVAHGNVLVNDRKVDIPSYLVEVGDVIRLKDHIKNNVYVEQAIELKKRGVIPSWLSVDVEKRQGKVIRLPERSDAPPNIKERLIVELYSK